MLASIKTDLSVELWQIVVVLKDKKWPRTFYIYYNDIFYKQKTTAMWLKMSFNTE